MAERGTTIYEIFKSFTLVDFASVGLNLLLLLICFAGVAIAIFRWKKHPAVSVISIVAVLTASVGAIGLFFLWIYFFEIRVTELIESGDSNKFIDIAISQRAGSSVLLLLMSLLQVILIPLYLIGMFVGRKAGNNPGRS